MPVPGPGSDTLISVRSGWGLHISKAIATLRAEARATRAALWDLNYQATWSFRCATGCTQTLGAPTVRVTRRDYRRAWYLFFLAWRCDATVEATMTVTCTPGRLPKPGARGEIPPVPPRDQEVRNANAVVEIDLRNPPTGSLECGQPFDFRIVMSELVEFCEGYSFARLYREALGRVKARADAVQCKPECGEKRHFIRAQTGECNDGLARVVLHASVVCPLPNAPVEQGVAIRADNELGAPFSDGDTQPSWSESMSIELRPAEESGGCQRSLSFWITLRATVDDCAAIADFEPYVSRVQTQAATMWRAIDCPLPCRMWPFQELGAEWDCKDGAVTVRYAFAAHCMNW